MLMQKNIFMDLLLENTNGVCLNCHETIPHIETDEKNKICPSCGTKAVYSLVAAYDDGFITIV